MVGSSTRDSPFVGRQREMAELTRALEDATSGCGRVVMLAGEPGIGKTRLSQELAALAQQRGAPVLWGRCHQQQGAPPYWPWIQPIRAYLQLTDPNALISQMGTGVADIAELIPEVRPRLPDLKLPPSPSLEPEQARFRLFDSITTFLKNASSSAGGLLIVLEDLHWADRSSLLLLEFAAREIASSPLLILGSYRDVEISRQHPLSETLGRLAREPAFSRVGLSGLHQHEVESLLESASGLTPSSSVVEAVYKRTEGNPLFVTQVARLMSREGGSWSGSIPQALRDVIGERLNHLSSECNRALAVASIIGREFDFELLGQMTDSSGDALLEVIEEALGAHVLEEAAGRMERYQFSHPLIQQTLYEGLSPSRRVRLHASIGEALERLYGEKAEAHAAELAHHFSKSETVLGPEKLVRYSAMAGERALAAYAYEEALAHFQRALAAKEGQPIDEETAALLFGLARTQLSLNQIQEAASSMERAFEYYADTGDISRAVAVAEYPHSPYSIYTMRDVIARTLDMVPPDSSEEGRVLISYGIALAQAERGIIKDDLSASHEAIDKALGLARRLGDRLLEMRALSTGAQLDLWSCNWKPCLEKSLKAVDMFEGGLDPVSEIRARQRAVLSLSVLGNGDRAVEQNVDLLALAEQVHDAYLLGIALALSGVPFYLKGDWQNARGCFTRSLNTDSFRPHTFAHLALLEYQNGNFEKGETYLESYRQGFQRYSRPVVAPVLPVLMTRILGVIISITDEGERLEEAMQFEQAAVSYHSPTPPYYSPVVGQALIATARGDAKASAEHYTTLLSWTSTMHHVVGVSIDRILGLLAKTMGRTDKAAEHFEEAIAFCRKAGYRPELAWTCYDYANLLHEQGQQRKALALLKEALDISTALGMRPLMKKAAALRERIGTRPARARIYPANLTERQVEVLRLLATGKTSHEIAEELVLSVQTVHRHVANIYAKIGARNRAEATAFALSKLDPIE